MNIAVEKLRNPISGADHHDPDLKWVVQGPGTERQCFVTKKDALKYASIRKNSASFAGAFQLYMKS
jgi:hypothetical protein